MVIRGSLKTQRRLTPVLGPKPKGSLPGPAMKTVTDRQTTGTMEPATFALVLKSLFPDVSLCLLTHHVWYLRVATRLDSMRTAFCT